jgi:hypothetical protein
MKTGHPVFDFGDVWLVYSVTFGALGPLVNRRAVAMVAWDKAADGSVNEYVVRPGAHKYDCNFYRDEECLEYVRLQTHAVGEISKAPGAVLGGYADRHLGMVRTAFGAVHTFATPDSTRLKSEPVYDASNGRAAPSITGPGAWTWLREAPDAKPLSNAHVFLGVEFGAPTIAASGEHTYTIDFETWRNTPIKGKFRSFRVAPTPMGLFDSRAYLDLLPYDQLPYLPGEDSASGGSDSLNEKPTISRTQTRTTATYTVLTW